eukprot:gene4684-3377_t
MADILPHILPYLDKQMVLGLLYFYLDKGLDVKDALLQLLETTPLTPDGSVKPEHERRILETTAIAKPALDAFFDLQPEGSPSLYQFNVTATKVEQSRHQGEMSLEFLAEKKGITQPVMTAVLQLAYLYYNKGSMEDASELLTLCQSVSGYDIDSEAVLWGKLMCDSGACNWQSAIEVAGMIRKNQKSEDEERFRRDNNGNKTTTRSRVWLLHWILFPFFKGGIQNSVQLLYFVFDYHSNFIYRSVVETVCPHYLRYICAAVLLNRTRYQNFRWAASMAESIYEYSDPLTELVLAIHRPHLEHALELLPKVSEVISMDYFLCDHESELIGNAKRMIFQKLMTMHTVVSIPYVAEKLGIAEAAAEVWLVNLVSESKQRAKVDSVNGLLNVEPQTRPVEVTVYEKIDSASRK